MENEPIIENIELENTEPEEEQQPEVLMKDMFDLLPEVAQAIDTIGYKAPTPIQLEAIPAMLEGRDVIGQAQTGTGKTAAFGIPVANAIDVNDRSVQVLILCPTRELAMQTAGEISKLCRYRRGINVLAVYGGQPIERQLRGLEIGVQVVVGTPGRVMDHMNRGSLKLDSVRTVILDEADEMLDMGFRDDMETILAATPETRRTALFSATMPAPILMLAQRYLKDPLKITIERKELTVEKIAQYYISVKPFHKIELLSRLLTLEDIKLALVFSNTKLGVETIVTELQHRGFSAAGLHGDMRQIERDAIMARYRRGLINVLVATDVAARGLDIDNIEAVFNYDIPLDVEYYVHRIGRTGRAGKEGKAYTFVVGREVARMWDYRRITGAKLLCMPAPDAKAVQSALTGRLLKQVNDPAAEETDEYYTKAAEKLLSDCEPAKAVAAMLKLLTATQGSRFDLTIDLNPPEPPKPAPKPAPDRRRGPYGRPVPRDFVPERKGPYGRPVPKDYVPSERKGPYGRPVPKDFVPGERKGSYGKPVPKDFVPSERKKPYGRPAKDFTPSEHRNDRRPAKAVPKGLLPDTHASYSKPQYSEKTGVKTHTTKKKPN